MTVIDRRVDPPVIWSYAALKRKFPGQQVITPSELLAASKKVWQAQKKDESHKKVLEQKVIRQTGTQWMLIALMVAVPITVGVIMAVSKLWAREKKSS